MSEELFQRLTPGEAFELEECEDALKESTKNFWQYVMALSKIRDGHLWRSTHRSFKDYCEQRWGITDSRARQLIGAAQIKDSLPTDLAALITNERQVRAISQVPVTQIREVMSNARSNGNVTANGIAQASERLTNRRQERAQIYDEIGTPITNDALPFWNRKQEVQDMIYSCSKIKTTIEKALSIDDPLYGRVSNGIIMELTAIRHHLLEAMPYTICTMCQGVPSMQPKGCSFCTNKGLISEHQWKTQVLDEVKKLRLKQNAEYAAERENATR